MSGKEIYKVNYWLKNPEGEVVDTSEGGEPMLIEIGSSTVIRGLQQAVKGRQAGDRLDVTVPPEMAYGVHNPEFVSQVPKSAFEGVENVVEGMKFQTNTGSEAQVVQVVKVENDFVLIDANHPLAGLTLNFELEVIEVLERS
jgi:FKBP-type peptidyl-prolyl cis-trans isomerase SlyD